MKERGGGSPGGCGAECLAGCSGQRRVARSAGGGERGDRPAGRVRGGGRGGKRAVSQKNPHQLHSPLTLICLGCGGLICLQPPHPPARRTTRPPQPTHNLPTP
eukprot:scaffold8506_cov62-Isochrysis_galbana.AAC.1